MVANRTAKAVGPTQLHQVVATRVLGGEAGLEFDQIARVILHSAVYYILGLPESSGYPTSYQTYTGTDYNLTVALLVIALIFSPAMLLLSWPVDFLSAASAAALSTFCLGSAWVSWSRFSTLTIASVVR